MGWLPKVADNGESDGVASALQHLDGLCVGDSREGESVHRRDLVVGHDAAAPVGHASRDHALHEDPAEVLCKEGCDSLFIIRYF